jgi:hypothetical protein
MSKTHRWHILLLRTKIQSLGSVEAPSEKAAIERAIKEFHITDWKQQKRLFARLENSWDVRTAMRDRDAKGN